MIESVDKLRARIYDSTLSNQTREDMERIADEIEREIAERYMELPVDADGVPIQVEDRMWYCGIDFDVFAVTGEVVFSKCDFKNGRYLVEAYDHSDVRHVKPRTLEYVLEEFGAAFEEEADDIRPLVDKYAEEIRELLEVGE